MRAITKKEILMDDPTWHLVLAVTLMALEWDEKCDDTETCIALSEACGDLRKHLSRSIE